HPHLPCHPERSQSPAKRNSRESKSLPERSRRDSMSAPHRNYCKLKLISPCLLKVIDSTFSCPLVNSPSTKADWSYLGTPAGASASEPDVTCTRRRCFPGDTCMAWSAWPWTWWNTTRCFLSVPSNTRV